MVEEVNYDLLPFWISHEAVADDEHKRDVGEEERERGYQGTTMVSVCLGSITFFVLFCPIFNALLDLSCPPLILDINKG